MSSNVLRLTTVGMLVAAATVHAQTIGLRGRRLTAVAGSRLEVVVRDPGVMLLPDPVATGATLTVTPGGGGGTLLLPAGPEWSVVPGALNRYLNPAAPAGPSPCSFAVVRNGRLLRVLCRDLGGLTLPTSGDLEVVLSDGNGFEEVMCFTASVNDGSRLVAENPTFAAGRCPSCIHVLAWGSRGSQPGEFVYPAGVAVDAGGNIYVTGYGGRIQKFDGAGALLAQWSAGTETVWSIAVDATGDLYVSQDHRVSKFDSGGTLLDTWGAGIYGTGDGEFNSPRGIAVDASGNVYVGDTGNDRIQKFDGSGTFLGSWGTSGSGNGEFLFPVGVAADGSGNVYVVDSGNHRIQKFDATGAFLAAWGSQGSGTGQLDTPRDLDIDATGNVYVADTLNNRIQKFDSAGNFEKAWGKFGRRPAQLHWPSGVTVDASGGVFVADSRNDRMQKFACP